MKHVLQRLSSEKNLPLIITFLFVSLLPPALFFGTFLIRDIWPGDELSLLGLHLLLVAIATVVFLSVIKIEGFIFVLYGIIGPFLSILVGGTLIGGTVPAGPVILIVMFYASGFILGLIIHQLFRR